MGMAGCADGLSGYQVVKLSGYQVERGTSGIDLNDHHREARPLHYVGA
jgi:hypothetical protein